MSFTWTDHQFVAGAACLDFVNTVIYRDDRERRHDRLHSLQACRQWAAAAARYGTLAGVGEVKDLAQLLALREAFDRLYRPLSEDPPSDRRRLLRLPKGMLAALGDADLQLGSDGLEPAVNGGRAASLDAQLAHSAVALAVSPRVHRIKACPSCAWLFVDMSNGRRRRWCDMRSCGNRAKAQRFYARRHAS